ncbi:hypothetical protein C2S51_016440 [Perilla frutescens var. frutescens]|nr:hypothetical protein C2S51_016440 [Perilla frutescens var. frutescens]
MNIATVGYPCLVGDHQLGSRLNGSATRTPWLQQETWQQLRNPFTFSFLLQQKEEQPVMLLLDNRACETMADSIEATCVFDSNCRTQPASQASGRRWQQVFSDEWRRQSSSVFSGELVYSCRHT